MQYRTLTHLFSSKMPPFYHKCSTLIVGDNMSGALALAKRQLQLSILRKSLAIFFQLFFRKLIYHVLWPAFVLKTKESSKKRIVGNQFKSVCPTFSASKSTWKRSVRTRTATMGTTQKYSLKWNDFTVNVASTFRDLHSRFVLFSPVLRLGLALSLGTLKMCSKGPEWQNLFTAVSCWPNGPCY